LAPHVNNRTIGAENPVVGSCPLDADTGFVRIDDLRLAEFSNHASLANFFFVAFRVMVLFAVGMSRRSI
jgi:hypothetical protein